MTLIKSPAAAEPAAPTAPAAAPEGTFKRNSVERWQQRKEWIRRRMEPTTTTNERRKKCVVKEPTKAETENRGVLRITHR